MKCLSISAIATYTLGSFKISNSFSLVSLVRTTSSEAVNLMIIFLANSSFSSLDYSSLTSSSSSLLVSSIESSFTNSISIYSSSIFYCSGVRCISSIFGDSFGYPLHFYTLESKNILKSVVGLMLLTNDFS